ncbi:MAG: GNAT family N-acetyltransferase [Hyphomicrobiales bacterium]
MPRRRDARPRASAGRVAKSLGRILAFVADPPAQGTPRRGRSDQPHDLAGPRGQQRARYRPAAIAALAAKHSAPEVLRRMRERLVFVAMLDGELAGTVSLAAERVHSVFVDPSRQGRGIGAAMMAFIEKLARRQGRERLSLASSLTAVNFYRKLGYEGSQREVRPGGIETVLMSKALLG